MRLPKKWVPENTTNEGRLEMYCWEDSRKMSFLIASEQRTGNIYPFYTLAILGQIFTIINVSSAL